MSTNKQIKLALRPEGLPTAATWKLEESPIPTIEDGQILIKQEYISLDPAMRGWIRDVKSYIPPVQVGEVMRAGTAGQIVESKNPNFKVGDYVSTWGGVQQYVANDGSMTFKVFPELAPLPTFIGTLGMPGMTAYFGILEVGKIKEGDTVLVSGGAGAVGSIVGQIAKLKGCKVIGIAGGPDKCKYMTEELGFDAAVDYKANNIYEDIKSTCKDGIDVYFDNVGGEILNTALIFLNMHARVVICGAISQYNSDTKDIKGPSNYLNLLITRSTMQGMVVLDYQKDWTAAGMEMAQWMAAGKLKSKEDIYEGIENFHETFLRLFNGDKLGKLVLKI